MHKRNVEAVRKRKLNVKQKITILILQIEW